MSERVIFTTEESQGHSLRIIVSGDVDDEMLDILEGYIGRQRKRLKAAQDRNRYPLPKEPA